MSGRNTTHGVSTRRYWMRLILSGVVAACFIPLLNVDSNGQMSWLDGIRRIIPATRKGVQNRFQRFRKKPTPVVPQPQNNPVPPVQKNAMAGGDQKPKGALSVSPPARLQARTPSHGSRGKSQQWDKTPSSKLIANRAIPIGQSPTEGRSILPDNFPRTPTHQKASPNFHTTQLPFAVSRRKPASTKPAGVRQVAFQDSPVQQSFQNAPVSQLQNVPVPQVDFTQPPSIDRAPTVGQYPPQRSYSPRQPVGPVVAPNSLPPVVNGQRTVNIPFNPPGDLRNQGTINISTNGGRLSLVAHNISLSRLLASIAKQVGLNIIATDDAEATVSVTLTDVALDDALNSILSVTGYTWTRHNDIITVSSMQSATMSPMAQGRIVRLFPLSFTSSIDIEPVVTGLLSTAGKVFTTATDTRDTRRSRETVVVEDIPEYVERIANYIQAIDQPPRQVMIEAHILQVDLSDTTEHGVNFQDLAQLAGTQVNITTTGLARADANPALLIGIDGGEVDGLRLIEALKSTNDTKTLASPKVTAVNGQESRIQIGGQLGFLQTTTTETATLQNVTFLEVGVVLTVTPYISDDGRILMKVKPEVSSGRINAETGLPEEETTEVETTVMLNDGQGMIIGGLIQEEDGDEQSKVPILGDALIVGRLFQRRRANKQRSEVIIALIPRILPYDEQYQAEHDIDYERVTTPLLEGPLRRHPRPWEPNLPDACPQDEGYTGDDCPDDGYFSGDPDHGSNVNYSAVETPARREIVAKPAQTRHYPRPDVDTATQQIAGNEPFFGSSSPVATIPNNVPKVLPAAYEKAKPLPIPPPVKLKPVPTASKLTPPPIVPSQPAYSAPTYRIPISPRRHR